MVVIPSRPTTDFIIAHAGLALATLDAFFDSVRCFGDAPEFFPFCFHRRIGKVVVVLHLSAFVA